MTQYLLSVHHDYGTEFPPLEEMQPVFAAVDRFNEKLQSEGAWVFDGGLTPIEQTTTVDNTGELPVAMIGPGGAAAVAAPAPVTHPRGRRTASRTLTPRPAAVTAPLPV